MTRLLSLEECAERTSTTVRWWRRAVFEKRVAVHHLGRLVRIHEDDLEAFVEAQSATGTGGDVAYSSAETDQ